MHSRSKSLAGMPGAAILMMCMTNGCFSNYRVPLDELVKLDGFRSGQSILLQTGGGPDQPVRFTANSRLTVNMIDDRKFAYSYSAISVRDMIFSGVGRNRDQQVRIDLRRAIGANVRNFSVGKTLGLTVGLPLGVLGLVGITFGVVGAFLSVNHIL